MSLQATDPVPAVYRPLWLAMALNFVWINVSEVFRYFVFVMPMMREAFPSVPDVAPMSVPVFLVWGLWDALLVAVVTFLIWVVLMRFGTGLRVALAAATVVWAAIFEIFWLAAFNMNMATVQVMAVALPLAWVELAVAALIVRWSLRRGE
ncbi:hypothetical protein [Pseudoruegeria sp. HB172150]|uniref:hypothetical protein n=1 Tax=Pseudoruegeria sp. HB172150 TaxID=2721164 RepID=UPI0015550D3B|nr:hypothetical protein [Pseudoruegeria sp. HB172150]